ncbi:MAG: pyridoxal-phosphate dependent enzyme [Nanoarchaeota archaeon]
MEKQRQKLYAEIASKVGNTPLVPYLGMMPDFNDNGNCIWIKRECDNPFGSHYDRVYISLFRDLEEHGDLKPGMNVLETSSGSAGVSFAGIGKLLGYNCYVMIPDDTIKQKRIEAIKAQGGTIIPTPSDEDIFGFTKKRIVENIKKYHAKFLNHSMGYKGSNNDITLRSLESIALEVLKARTDFDIFVAGIGNGSSIVGPGRIFRKNNPDIQIIGYMPKKVGKSQYPGLMNQNGINHPIDFPHIKEAQKLMNRVEFVDDLDIPFYHRDLGKTSQAGIRVALDLARQVQEKYILVIGYDKSERYCE